MPAGKAKAKQADPPEPEIEVEEPEEELEDDLEPDLEVPAVGEAVTYVEWDENRLSYFEFAALITLIEQNGSVQLIVFAPHARSGRSFSGVTYSQEDVIQEPFTHWRYPQVATPVSVEE